ncbi:MAG: accessory gene regulator B family protein [Pseudobutyrivibrio sp.]|nr:accessory gene regulator B family protein [Pseudobutyrivibrio sp.]
MDTLAIKIVNHFARWTNKKFNIDDMEVYYYGMICLLNQLCVNSIIAIWAIITHCFFETLCFLSVFTFLRHHAGGYHAKSNERCVIFSSLIVIPLKIILPYSHWITSKRFPIIILVLFISTLLAPIDSKKFELSRRQKLCEKTITLCIIIVCSVVSNYIPANYITAILYSLLVTSFLMILSKIKHIV